MDLKSFTYQSSQIFYRVAGNGKTIILIHGFGEDGEIWNNQVEFLKERYRVIIPDLPGSGKSALINDMSIEGMAEVIKELLAIEEIQDGVTFGHSMGGYITLALAEKYPETLPAFGLVHSSAYPDSEEKKATRLKSIEFMKNNGGYKFLKTSIPGLFSSEWSMKNGQITGALIERGKAFTTEALIHYYQAMYNRPDRTTVLKNFKGPILFISGIYDIAAPFNESLQQCYLPQCSHIHILRNCAHMGMLEDPQKVNQAIDSFLQDL